LALITLAAFLARKLPLASESGLFRPVVRDVFSEFFIETYKKEFQKMLNLHQITCELA
jgi:hypothetical protein